VKELVKRAAEALQAAGELLRKLPRRDKWVLAVIVVLLVFVGGVLLFLDGGQDYQRVWSSRETDSPLALQRFAARLSENGIAWSPGQLPGGERTISVPAASLDRAVALRDGGTGSDRNGSSAEPVEKSSIFDTPEKLEAKLREANRRKAEQWIILNENIQVASILVSPARRQLLSSSRSAGETASVMLSLQPGVARLPPQEADAVREMVRSALGLKRESVFIIDNFGNRYDAVSEGDAPGRVLEKEEKLRTFLRNEIQSMLAKSFDERDFFVGVIVSLSPQRSTIERKEMDRAGSFTLESEFQTRRGAPAPGGLVSKTDGPIGLSESIKSVPFESYKKTQIDIPPGELKSTSVIVRLNLEAVESLTARASGSARPERLSPSPAASPTAAAREAIIQQFVAQQESSLRGFLTPCGSVSVSVMVQPFVHVPLEVPVEPPRIATLEPSVGLSELVNWLGRFWKPLVGIALIGGSLVLLLSAVLRRRTGPTGWSGIASAAIGAGGGDWHPPVAGASAEGLDVLPEVERITAAVRERPEEAASVLRLWLAQDEEAHEEVSRS